MRRCPLTTLPALALSLVIAGPTLAQQLEREPVRHLGAPAQARADGGDAEDDLLQSARGTTAAVLNDFAFDLYKQLHAEEEGNIFLSPYSIHSALSMTAKGASGRTAEQMLSTLRWGDADKVDPHAHSAALLSYLNAMEGEKLRLSVANALWVQDGYPLKAPFTKTINEKYGAKVAPLKFKSDPGEARERINAWVAERTEEKIEDLMPEGSIDEMTRLVLTNAIYFKGAWVHDFNERATRDQPFTLADGKEVEAPLMYQRERFRYASFFGGKAVGMPYKDGTLEMVVLLPDEPDGLAKLEEKLSVKMLEEWLSGFGARKVKLWLPKFELKWKSGLNGPLAEMGMADAFDRGKADFSGITDAESLFISKVVHEAYVKVDERGTEAAAATGIAVAATRAVMDKPVEFRADHPFLYLIRDRETGAILFLGRVLDPR